MHGAGGTGAEYAISLCIAPKRRPEAAATATAKVQPGGAGVHRVSPQAGPASATGRALSSMRNLMQTLLAPFAHCSPCQPQRVLRHAKTRRGQRAFGRAWNRGTAEHE